MAETQLAAASRVQRWEAQYMKEYVRESRFAPYYGRADGNAMMPIVVNRTLESAGKTVNIPLITRIAGGSVRGTTRLTGNEVALGNYNQSLTCNWHRIGVTVKKPEESWTEIDIRNAAKVMLKKRGGELLRDDIITAMMAFAGTSWLCGVDADDTSTAERSPLAAYTAVSEGTKDDWIEANRDRYLFGNAVSNFDTTNGGDHSASLLNIDTTSDRLTAAHVSLAKSVALEAGRTGLTANERYITPFRVDDDAGREWFIYFVGSRGFRDLKNDPPMVSANREARPRDVESNPIFQSGDLIWDGVIIREVPEIPVLTGVGAGPSDVQPGFFCGAQSAAIAWKQMVKSRIKQETDYDFEYGVNIEEARGVAKLVFNGVQHGMVNTYYSAPATA